MGENVKNTYNDLSANLEANLYEKGDYVEYSIIVENKGTFDAKLETIGITNSNNEAVKITSSGLTKGQTLYKNTTATLKVKIEYNSSYEGDASGTSGESTVDLEFTQNSGGTIEPENNHLVTYDYSTNGGSSTNAENEYINEGESINLSYTATKEGYDFIGWNTNKDATEGLTELTMGTIDVTLYAIFRAPDTTPPVIENVSTSSTTNSITVVVTANDEESGISKYEFKINDNEWIDNGTNNTYTFTGLTQDTGYDISVRVTNGVDLTAEEEVSESIKLTDNVVTSGDGLYKDSYEENVYTYRGINPNNYVMFNNELWRIISLDIDKNTIKIIRNSKLPDGWQFDVENNRYQNNGYCISDSCNIWGSIDTLYDANMIPITSIGREVNGPEFQLPSYEAKLNIYLNNEYYNELNNLAKKMVIRDVYKVGVLDSSDNQETKVDLEQVSSVKWKGKVGLIDATEYVRASTNDNCTGAYAYYKYGDDACYNNSKNHNWMYDNYFNWWTLSPYSSTTSTYVWAVTTLGYLSENGSNGKAYSVRPVVTLSGEVQITSGDGSSISPYQLSAQ